MSRVRTWLVSDRQFLNYFRAISRKLPNHCHSFLFSQALSATNFSSYLSFLFRNQTKRNPTSSALRVPPTGGTLSFRRDRIPACRTGRYPVPAGDQKAIWFLEIEKIPPRHREGMIKFIDKYRPGIFLCSVFSPRSYSYDLASESDFYFIKKSSWRPIATQLRSIYFRANKRQSNPVNFPKIFTLQEKLVMRVFWRFRRQFVSLDELSSYLYGRKMPKNLHSSEVIVSGLREKLKKSTGRSGVISWMRNYGYRVEEEVWEELLKK